MRPLALFGGSAGAAVAGVCCLGWAPLLAFLGGTGLGFLLHDAILLPLLAGFLALAAWGAFTDATREERDGPADACRPGEMSGIGALFGWGVPILAIAIGSFVHELVLWLWIPAFAVMGVTCLANVRRCGRVHCYATGPLFLAMSAFLVAVAAGWTPEAWIGPASMVVVVGVALAYGSELVAGRYR